MKILVKETENEGLEAFLGKRIVLFCGIYIYSGTLVGINSSCVKLEDAGIVYETGPFSDKFWKDYQKVSDSLYVTLQSIEAFGPGK